MSTPHFPENPFTDVVPRRGATSSKAGFDTYRRLAAVEQAMGANTSVDTDALNLMRALGSSIIAWTFDPAICTDTISHIKSLVDGSLYVFAVYLPSPATVTGVSTYVYTAGVGTWGTSKVALYGADGARLAQSNSDTSAWKATGLYDRAFSATYDADRGLYYVAFLNVRTATTTAPQLACRNSFSTALSNVRTAASFPRSCLFPAQTDMPASLTFSSANLSTSPIWAGLY